MRFLKKRIIPSSGERIEENHRQPGWEQHREGQQGSRASSEMESKNKSSSVMTTPIQDAAEETNNGQGNKSKPKSDVEESTENSLKKPPPTTQHQPPSSPQQNATKKRLRNASSPAQTSQFQISEIWNRYDLADPELTSDYERAELEAVQKQIWRPKKFVPYTGLSSLQS